MVSAAVGSSAGLVEALAGPKPHLKILPPVVSPSIKAPACLGA